MKLFRILLLVFVVLIWMFPVVFLILGATNHSGWAYQIPISFQIGNQFRINYDYLYQTFYVNSVIFNSIVVSISTALISIIVIVFASYAFSKYHFKFKNILFGIFIASIIIPQISTLVGNLKLISAIGLYGTIFGLILPFTINIRVFYYLMNMFHYIPNEIIDSARIDGASDLQIVNKISIPMTLDKIALSFFMLFVSSWNNFLIPMIMMNSRRRFTIPVMLSSLSDPLSYNTGSTLLALLIAIIPPLLLYIGLSNIIYNKNSV